MIKIYNRYTKEYELEKVSGERLINILYNTAPGKLGLELLVKKRLCSDLSGLICDSRFSAGKIKQFIKEYDIDMSESLNKIEDFKTFNDFFTRRLKSDARHFNAENGLFLSPGDGRIRAWADIDIEKAVQVKDSYYNIGELLANSELANKYRGGTKIILRLCPVDYHRYHFIDDGICSESTRIKGHYYSVNPAALTSIPKVFCSNKREYSILHSDNFGDVLYMEVGATSVGSIVQTYMPGVRVKRGSEKGFFKFGGSTIILLIEKGLVGMDEDILYQTRAGFECKVAAGEVIGKKIL
ncbi:MAG: phosphatidylserine decarboxylase [Bacillota bacterium]